MNNVFAMENRYPVKNCSCPGFAYPEHLKDFRNFVVFCRQMRAHV